MAHVTPRRDAHNSLRRQARAAGFDNEAIQIHEESQDAEGWVVAFVQVENRRITALGEERFRPIIGEV